METLQNIEISYDELKSLVIKSIKKHGDYFQFSNLCYSIAKNAVEMELVKCSMATISGVSFHLSINDESRVREIIWDLIVERVITIGDYQNPSWPFLSLTEYGVKAIKSDIPIPNDPSGYLNRIKTLIPDLDSVIEIYLSESIRTYNINQLLSSTNTLGCASEKALLILIDSFCNTFIDIERKSKFEKKLSGKLIKNQFDEFNKEIEIIKKDFPYELKEKYTNTLVGVFEMIRKNRNSTGHPTGIMVDKDTLYANLQVFITYCKYLYDLKDWFEANKH